jgi:hypothetical protein
MTGNRLAQNGTVPSAHRAFDQSPGHEPWLWKLRPTGECRRSEGGEAERLGKARG